MRAAAFMSWFAPLFILYVVLIVGYHIGRAARIEAAERKARQERERIAAERKEKTEARKREQAAARSAKTAEATAQGLGTCILGWLDPEKIQTICKLDGTVRLVIVIGYPKQDDVLRKKKRKSPLPLR